MAISVPPLVIDYSFAANAAQAQDRVDLAQLDAVLAQINGTITALIDTVNTIQRDDDTLADQAIELRNLNDDAMAKIISTVNAAVETAPA